MIKYPKTPRLSKLIGTSEIENFNPYNVIVEEKVDGANSAISFDKSKLVLQSRGHVLSGGPREALFERMWPWAYERQDSLQETLGNRYILFGEWMYAKNRLFYDALPDYFVAFDVWDKEQKFFVTTSHCQELAEASMVKQVETIWSGKFSKAPTFSSLIKPSKYKTENWKDRFNEIMNSSIGKHYDLSETDDTILAEGVYIKIEDDQKVIGRIKLPRETFEKIQTNDQKWGRRPIFPNQLLAGVK